MKKQWNGVTVIVMLAAPKPVQRGVRVGATTMHFYSRKSGYGAPNAGKI